MTEKLKPCPFCGGEAGSWEDYTGNWHIKCFDCFAKGPLESDEEEAVTTWNTRASQWKNNEEEKPEKEGMYLISDGHMVCFARWEKPDGAVLEILEQMGAETHIWIYPNQCGDITHWQELPAPPKEENP